MVSFPINGDGLVLERLTKKTRHHEVLTLLGPVGVEESENRVIQSVLLVVRSQERLADVLDHCIRHSTVKRRGLFVLRNDHRLPINFRTGGVEDLLHTRVFAQFENVTNAVDVVQDRHRIFLGPLNPDDRRIMKNVVKLM